MKTANKSPWLLTVMMALGGCDGTAIFIPEDNTRLSYSQVPPSSAPYAIQVLLDANEHAWASDPGNDWSNLFRLEGYSDLHGGWSEALASPPYYTGMALTLPTGTSYWWRFEIDLGDLGLYSQPGTWGPSFMFRLFIMDSGGEWRAIPGITVSWQECLRMLDEDQAPYCPYTYEVRLRAPTYVPNVTKGWVSYENGDDFSRCTPYLGHQADQIYRSHNKINGHIRFNGDEGIHKHNQGLARFAGWDESSGNHVVRVAVSYNDDKGFTTVLKNRSEEASSWSADGTRTELDIRGAYAHPGGMQAHGNVVVIGMEQPHDTSEGAQALFVRFTGSAADPTPEVLNWHNIPPVLAQQYGMAPNAAAAAGFVKLASGYFLLAVAGANHGREGVWFFESSETVLSVYTKWHLVDVWKPPCNGWGRIEGGEHCWAGAAASVNLLTGCFGDVFMYSLSGTRGGGKDYSETQLWQIVQDSNGRVVPQFVLERRKGLGFFSAKDPSCRWACGVHTLSDGTLTMAAMIKQKAGVNNTIETYLPKLVLAPKSGDEIIATYYDDRQDDPAYDAAQLPGDWSQAIEDAYDAEEDL